MPLRESPQLTGNFSFLRKFRSFSDNNIIKDSDRSPMKMGPKDGVRTYIDSHIF